MRDVPILNLHLQVEAVSFQVFADGWLGVLISSWFMNLVWLPPVETGVTAVADLLTLQLPSGEYECLPNQVGGVGVFYTCSLFSPVLQFEDQAAAVLTAQHIMLSVLDERVSGVVDTGVGKKTSTGSVSGNCSRRDFLRGRLFL